MEGIGGPPVRANPLVMASFVSSFRNSVLGLTFDIHKDDRLPYFDVLLRGVTVFHAESEALALYGIRVYHDRDFIGDVLTEQGNIPMYSYLQSLKSASNYEKLKRAAELLSCKTVVSLHDEAKRYCFKCADGTISTVDFQFLNGLAGLGYINHLEGSANHSLL